MRRGGDPPPESSRPAWLAYWLERQNAVGLDFKSDRLDPHELPTFERLVRAGEKVSPIWNDPSRPTSDYNWINRGVIGVEVN